MLQKQDQKKIFFAVSRGRVLQSALPILDALNCAPLDGFDDSRKLTIETFDPGIDLLVLRGVDVLTYVERGISGLGIVGKDILMEHKGSEVYELLDLNIAHCRMVVAGSPESLTPNGKSGRRLRVATKYPSSTLEHFAKTGEQVEIIKLHGTTELAPRLNLSDFIVDIVDTGKTLQANGLKVHEEIATITARLVANKALMKTQFKRINTIVNLLKETVHH